MLHTLQTAEFSLDSKIERRNVAHLMSKTFKGAWSLFANIAAMLTLNWQLTSDKMDNAAFSIPQAKAEEAAGAASATNIVHSAGGSVTITITPTLAPSTLTG